MCMDSIKQDVESELKKRIEEANGDRVSINSKDLNVLIDKGLVFLESGGYSYRGNYLDINNVLLS